MEELLDDAAAWATGLFARRLDMFDGRQRHFEFQVYDARELCLQHRVAALGVFAFVVLGMAWALYARWSRVSYKTLLDERAEWRQDLIDLEMECQHLEDECAVWKKWRDEYALVASSSNQKLDKTTAALVKLREESRTRLPSVAEHPPQISDSSYAQGICGNLEAFNECLHRILEPRVTVLSKYVAMIRVSCRNLVQTDWLSASDPIVVVEVRGSKAEAFRYYAQSEWFKNNANPMFKTSFYFDTDADASVECAAGFPEVRFSVYDVDSGSLGNLIGQATLPLADLRTWYFSSPPDNKASGGVLSTPALELPLTHHSDEKLDAALAESKSVIVFSPQHLPSMLAPQRGTIEGESASTHTAHVMHRLSTLVSLASSVLNILTVFSAKGCSQDMRAITARLMVPGLELPMPLSGRKHRARGENAHFVPDSPKRKAVRAQDSLLESLVSPLGLGVSGDVLSNFSRLVHRPAHEVTQLMQHNVELERKLKQWEGLGKRTSDKIKALEQDKEGLVRQLSRNMDYSAMRRVSELERAILDSEGTVNSLRFQLHDRKEGKSEAALSPSSPSQATINAEALRRTVREQSRRIGELEKANRDLQSLSQSQSQSVQEAKEALAGKERLNESLLAAVHKSTNIDVASLASPSSSRRQLLSSSFSASPSSALEMSISRSSHHSSASGSFKGTRGEYSLSVGCRDLVGALTSTFVVCYQDPSPSASGSSFDSVKLGRTESTHSDPNPTFAQKFSFTDSGGGGRIKLDVYDMDFKSRSDHMGFATIDLDRLTRKLGQPLVLPLAHSDPQLHRKLIRSNSRVVLYAN
jgi:hypothetical protein